MVEANRDQSDDRVEDESGQELFDAASKRVEALKTAIEIMADIETTDSTVIAKPAKQMRNEIVDILKTTGGPRHYTDIYRQLLDRGFDVTGKDPKKNVGTHLSNDDRFASLVEGRWALKSWHDAQSQSSSRPTAEPVSLRERLRERDTTMPATDIVDKTGSVTDFAGKSLLDQWAREQFR